LRLDAAPTITLAAPHGSAVLSAAGARYNDEPPEPLVTNVAEFMEDFH
jgi:hypothetical protein